MPDNNSKELMRVGNTLREVRAIIRLVPHQKVSRRIPIHCNGHCNDLTISDNGRTITRNRILLLKKNTGSIAHDIITKNSTHTSHTVDTGTNQLECHHCAVRNFNLLERLHSNTDAEVNTDSAELERWPGNVGTVEGDVSCLGAHRFRVASFNHMQRRVASKSCAPWHSPSKDISATPQCATLS